VNSRQLTAACGLAVRLVGSRRRRRGISNIEQGIEDEEVEDLQQAGSRTSVSSFDNRHRVIYSGAVLAGLAGAFFGMLGGLLLADVEANTETIAVLSLGIACGGGVGVYGGIVLGRVMFNISRSG